VPALAEVSHSVGIASRHAEVGVKSEDCWIFSPGPHPLRVVF